MHVHGTCYAVFAYDFGFSLDLDAAEERITDERRRLRFEDERRAPHSEGERPPPLRVTQIGRPLDVDGYRTESSTELVLLEVGAGSISYQIPVSGSLDDLVGLSASLYDNTALLADSRRRMEELIAALGDAIAQPALSEIVEDYVIVCVQPDDDSPIASLWEQHGPAVARILRGEPGRLSEQEIADALAQRASYTPDDVAIIDWHAALLLGRGMSNERAVLELSTVELLSLRLLDTKLDRAIDSAYELLAPRAGWRGKVRSRAVALERVAQLQAEAAVLFEGVNNAFKLVGDQYLARLYRVASARFRLAEWDATIERKLATLDTIYEKLSTRANNRRLELLEWVIVILIAIEIALALLGRL